MQTPKSETVDSPEKEQPINIVVNRLNVLVSTTQQEGAATSELVNEVNRMLEPVRSQESFLMHWNYSYLGMDNTEQGKLIARIYRIINNHKDYPDAGPCLVLRPVNQRLQDFYNRQYHQLEVWPIPEAMTIPIASVETPLLLLGRPFFTYDPESV